MASNTQDEADERWFRGTEDARGAPEFRRCWDCGEEWHDDGNIPCPECGSDNTEGGL